MKKLILCLAIIALPLLAEEIWLGLVVGVQRDYLILVDDLKVYAPNITFIDKDHQALDATAVVFPFTASMITHDGIVETSTTITPIKIHTFYEHVDGKLVERASNK